LLAHEREAEVKIVSSRVDIALSREPSTGEAREAVVSVRDYIVPEDLPRLTNRFTASRSAKAAPHARREATFSVRRPLGTGVDKYYILFKINMVGCHTIVVIVTHRRRTLLPAPL
jgi:hypothetical protein